MALEQLINEKLKEAMKSGEKLRLDTLRSIRASIIEYNKSGATTAMDEATEFKILNSLAKKRKDAIAMYQQAGRTELAENEMKELEIIQEFLPQMMSEEEVEKVIDEIMTNANASAQSDLGKVMGPAMKTLNGKAEGSLVQAIVKRKLGIV